MMSLPSERLFYACLLTLSTWGAWPGHFSFAAAASATNGKASKATTEGTHLGKTIATSTHHLSHLSLCSTLSEEWLRWKSGQQGGASWKMRRSNRALLLVFMPPLPAECFEQNSSRARQQSGEKSAHLEPCDELFELEMYEAIVGRMGRDVRVEVVAHRDEVPQRFKAVDRRFNKLRFECATNKYPVWKWFDVMEGWAQLVYDRCGRLTARLQMNGSALAVEHFHFQETLRALKTASEDSPCGPCNSEYSTANATSNSPPSTEKVSNSLQSTSYPVPAAHCGQQLCGQPEPTVTNWPKPAVTAPSEEGALWPFTEHGAATAEEGQEDVGMQDQAAEPIEQKPPAAMTAKVSPNAREYGAQTSSVIAVAHPQEHVHHAQQQQSRRIPAQSQVYNVAHGTASANKDGQAEPMLQANSRSRVAPPVPQYYHLPSQQYSPSSQYREQRYQTQQQTYVHPAEHPATTPQPQSQQQQRRVTTYSPSAQRSRTYLYGSSAVQRQPTPQPQTLAQAQNMPQQPERQTQIDPSLLYPTAAPPSSTRPPIRYSQDLHQERYPYSLGGKSRTTHGWSGGVSTPAVARHDATPSSQDLQKKPTLTGQSATSRQSQPSRHYPQQQQSISQPQSTKEVSSAELARQREYQERLAEWHKQNEARKHPPQQQQLLGQGQPSSHTQQVRPTQPISPSTSTSRSRIESLPVIEPAPLYPEDDARPIQKEAGKTTEEPATDYYSDDYLADWTTAFPQLQIPKPSQPSQAWPTAHPFLSGTSNKGGRTLRDNGELDLPCASYTDEICWHQQVQLRPHEVHRCCKERVLLSEQCLPGRCSNATQQLCCIQKFLQAKLSCCLDKRQSEMPAGDQFSRCCYSNFVGSSDEDDKEEGSSGRIAWMDSQSSSAGGGVGEGCCPREYAKSQWRSVGELCLPNVGLDLTRVRVPIVTKLGTVETTTEFEFGKVPEKWQFECKHGRHVPQFLYLRDEDGGRGKSEGGEKSVGEY